MAANLGAALDRILALMYNGPGDARPRPRVAIGAPPYLVLAGYNGREHPAAVLALVRVIAGHVRDDEGRYELAQNSILLRFGFAPLPVDALNVARSGQPPK